jgi:hypothetical protein
MAEIGFARANPEGWRNLRPASGDFHQPDPCKNKKSRKINELRNWHAPCNSFDIGSRMVRRPTIEGLSHVDPFRNRSAHCLLARRRTVLRSHRSRHRRPYHPHRLIRTLIMNRSILIGLIAFSTTILLIPTQTGGALA